MQYRFCHIMSSIFLVVTIAIFSSLAAAENEPPMMSSIGRQYVLEGDTLDLHIVATDLEKDDIILDLTSRPLGAAFTDNGDGTGDFGWSPSFSGPYSSNGSPFELAFWASDGSGSTLMRVEVVVINKNRKPSLVSPETISAVAGNTISFDLTASDPDNDPVGWQIISLPEGAAFTGSEPGLFEWKTAFGDTGNFDVKIAVSDQYGASDTADVILEVEPAVIYALSIDTASGYSGEVVSLEIKLNNLVPISGFDILFNYDVTALTMSSISLNGTRAASFEYFTYLINARGMTGDIRAVGIANVAGSGDTPDLAAGEGAIINLSFYITNDLSFAGFSIPVIFSFRDLLNGTDNILTDTADVSIGQSQISYTNGYISIKETSTSSLGDINLNNVSYEIGDVVYLTNYFIDPTNFPLNAEQRLNSDVNQDGLAPTVADLVYLRNKVLNLSSSKLRPISKDVTIALDTSDGNRVLYYSSALELGALALTLEASAATIGDPDLHSAIADAGMLCKWKVDGGLLRLLIYSDNGQVMPSGAHGFLSLPRGTEFEIKEIQISSTDGYVLPAVIKDNLDGMVARGFALYQNYPNPFNPSTEIDFYLPIGTAVDLTVYNVIGQEIKRLISKELSAGHHTVMWDGKNSQGELVSSGIYFYRLNAGEFTAKRKMIFLK